MATPQQRGIVDAMEVAVASLKTHVEDNIEDKTLANEVVSKLDEAETLLSDWCYNHEDGDDE